MRQSMIAFAAGLLFGVGLLISRMVDPSKVLSFLNFAGHWDPSLAFVMGGGVAVAAAGFAIGRRQGRSWVGNAFPMLAHRGVSARLVGGAALFGLGWGLIGLCPGPALTALPLAPLMLGPFVLAMLAGIWGVRALTLPRQRQAASSAPSPVQNSR